METKIVKWHENKMMLKTHAGTAGVMFDFSGVLRKPSFFSSVFSRLLPVVNILREVMIFLLKIFGWKCSRDVAARWAGGLETLYQRVSHA